jgi:hypothetical protein
MSPPPDAVRDVRMRNLLFLSTPKLWPAWPILPLIRRDPGCEDECGVLYDVFGLKGLAGFSATVFKCMILMMPRTEADFLALPRETYDSAEEVFEQGWRVD